MTRHDEFTAQLEAYLDEYEGSTPLPERVRDAVRAQLPSRQQRPAWWPARTPPRMNNIAKFALGAVATVAVAFLGIQFLMPGGLSVGDSPDHTETPSPAASPSQIGLTAEPFGAGRYSLGSEFPVGITFNVSDGWSSCSQGPLEQGICRGPGNFEAVGGAAVGFLIVDNVVAEPCDGTSLLDPPVGPSIDDLAAAIANLPGFDATTAMDVSVDGFDAKRLTVTAPENSGCNLSTWATQDRTNGVADGEANLLYLVDVDGLAVMMAATYYPSAPSSDEDLAVAEEVIASIRIEAP